MVLFVVIDRLKSMNRWLVTGLLCFFIFIALGTIKFLQIRAAIAFGESFPETSESIETVIIAPSLWQDSIELTASVLASRDVVLRTEVDGVISNVGFRSGEQVEAGQLILELDASEERARRQAMLAEIEFAEKDAKRIHGLRNQDAISRQQRDQIETRLAVARAQLANIDEAIANKQVIAPFTGRAGIHDFEKREFLRSGSVVTRLVGGLDLLWLDFDLPQKYASVPVGTQLTIIDNRGLDLRAKVVAVEPSVSLESRTVKARAELSDTGRQLKPGSFIRISVPVGEQMRVYKVPSTAVRKDELGDYVFVIEKDDKGDWRANRQPITVAKIEGDQAIVGQGIKSGDQLATLGSFKLQIGKLVNIAKTTGAEESTRVSSEPAQDVGTLNKHASENGLDTKLNNDG